MLRLLISARSDSTAGQWRWEEDGNGPSVSGIRLLQRHGGPPPRLQSLPSCCVVLSRGEGVPAQGYTMSSVDLDGGRWEGGGKSSYHLYLFFDSLSHNN